MATATSLFGSSQQSSGAGPPTMAPGRLVEVKAGKLVMDPGSKLVTPETDKGLIYLKESEGMMNFVWRNRGSGQDDDPILLFQDATFRKCLSCADGRVFYLKFHNSERREFFWMQEPDAEKDEERCRKVNDIIMGRSTGGASAGAGAPATPGGATAADLAMMGLDPEALAQLQATGLGSEELMQMMGSFGGAGAGGAGPPVTPMVAAPGEAPNAPTRATGQAREPTDTPMPAARSEPAAATPAAGGAINPELLQGLIQGLAAQAQSQQQGMEAQADLQDILTPDAIEALLSDPETVQQLLPFLPEGSNASAEDIRANVRSPQFQQALASFSMALRTGQLGSMVSQFGVDAAVAAARGGGSNGFVAAINEQEGAAGQEGQDDATMDESSA